MSTATGSYLWRYLMSLGGTSWCYLIKTGNIQCYAWEVPHRPEVATSSSYRRYLIEHTLYSGRRGRYLKHRGVVSAYHTINIVNAWTSTKCKYNALIAFILHSYCIKMQKNIEHNRFACKTLWQCMKSAEYIETCMLTWFVYKTELNAL